MTLAIEKELKDILTNPKLSPANRISHLVKIEPRTDLIPRLDQIWEFIFLLLNSPSLRLIRTLMFVRDSNAIPNDDVSPSITQLVTWGLIAPTIHGYELTTLGKCVINTGDDHCASHGTPQDDINFGSFAEYKKSDTISPELKACYAALADLYPVAPEVVVEDAVPEALPVVKIPMPVMPFAEATGIEIPVEPLTTEETVKE